MQMNLSSERKTQITKLAAALVQTAFLSRTGAPEWDEIRAEALNKSH
jgi:hypothetical protein